MKCAFCDEVALMMAAGKPVCEHCSYAFEHGQTYSEAVFKTMDGEELGQRGPAFTLAHRAWPYFDFDLEHSHSDHNNRGLRLNLTIVVEENSGQPEHSYMSITGDTVGGDAIFDEPADVDLEWALEYVDFYKQVAEADVAEAMRLTSGRVGHDEVGKMMYSYLVAHEEEIIEHWEKVLRERGCTRPQ